MIMLVHYSSVWTYYEGRAKNLLEEYCSWSFLSFAHYAQFCVALRSKDFRIECNGIHFESYYRWDLYKTFLLSRNYVTFLHSVIFVLSDIFGISFYLAMKYMLQKRLIISKTCSKKISRVFVSILETRRNMD